MYEEEKKRIDWRCSRCQNAGTFQVPMDTDNDWIRIRAKSAHKQESPLCRDAWITVTEKPKARGAV